MVYIFTLIGPPGAGKDTQAELLAKKANFTYTSMSNILASYIPNFRNLPTYKKGLLFPISTVKEALLNYLQNYSGKPLLVITGIPRTLKQAKLLIQNCRQSEYFFISTIYLYISPQNALDRLNGRLYCPKCGATYHPKFKPPQKAGVCDIDGTRLKKRPDDAPEIIKNRYNLFLKELAPIQKYLQEHDAFTQINGEGDINTVFKRLINAIYSKLNKILPQNNSAKNI